MQCTNHYHNSNGVYDKMTAYYGNICGYNDDEVNNVKPNLIITDFVCYDVLFYNTTIRVFTLVSF